MSLLLQLAFLTVQLQPLLQHSQLIIVLRLLSIVRFQLFQPRRHTRLIHLLQLGKRALFPALFLFQFRQTGGHGFQLGGQRVDLCLFLRIIARDDQRLGDQVTRPAFVFFLALLVRFDDALMSPLSSRRRRSGSNRPASSLPSNPSDAGKCRSASIERLIGVMLEQVFCQG